MQPQLPVWHDEADIEDYIAHLSPDALSKLNELTEEALRRNGWIAAPESRRWIIERRGVVAFLTQVGIQVDELFESDDAWEAEWQEQQVEMAECPAPRLEVLEGQRERMELAA